MKKRQTFGRPMSLSFAVKEEKPRDVLYILTDLSVYFPKKMLYNGKAILFLLC